jgi:hypothetical protein
VFASAAAGEALDEFPALQCIGELIFEVCGEYYRYRDKGTYKTKPRRSGALLS